MALFHDFKRFFVEICSSKRKCLDNLDFFKHLGGRIGSGTLKAA